MYLSKICQKIISHSFSVCTY